MKGGAKPPAGARPRPTEEERWYYLLCPESEAEAHLERLRARCPLTPSTRRAWMARRRLAQMRMAEWGLELAALVAHREREGQSPEAAVRWAVEQACLQMVRCARTLMEQSGLAVGRGEDDRLPQRIDSFTRALKAFAEMEKIAERNRPSTPIHVHLVAEPGGEETIGPPPAPPEKGP